MKNLSVVRSKLRHLGKDAIAYCIDADNDILFTISETLELYKFEKDHTVSVPLKHPIIQDKNSIVTKTSVLCFEYLVEFNCLILALRDGRILSLGVAFNDFDKIYRHPVELDSVQLSPSQDLIAIADIENLVTLLTSDLLLVTKSNAATNQDSANKAVGVGWGSKETQFFGLDGRPSKEGNAKETIVMSDEEVQLYEKVETHPDFCRYIHNKKCNTIIDWRGDGQYLASLTHYPDIDKHQLKVWNRNLVLQYMSDKLVNIEAGLLHWIPNGNFVCCAQRREKKINEILFLEKNGMIHMRLELPTILNNIYIEDFSWSPNSSILAILVRKYDAQHEDHKSIRRRSMLMLYTLSNHHFYLKHSRYLDQIDTDYSLKWNSNDSYCLHILSQRGHYEELRSTFRVDVSNDCGNIAVVDGNKLLLTPMRKCSIPPPMSAIVVELPELIKTIGLHKKDSSNIVILTVEGTIVIFNNDLPDSDLSDEYMRVSYDDENMVSLLPSVTNSKKRHIFHIPMGDSFDQIEPISSSKHAILKDSIHGSQLDYINLTIDDHTLKTSHHVETVKKYEDFKIVSMVNLPNHYFRVILSNGCVYSAIDNNYQPIGKLPVEPMKGLLKSEIHKSGQLITLSLDHTLASCDKIIASKTCTSFSLTEQFLIYTTACNTLKIMPFEEIAKDHYKDQDCWSQQIEAGGSIIFVNPEEAKVILQMPRGNLEILHPRLLVLTLVEQLMSQKKYFEAFQVARRHRLNLNFLADCLLYTPDLYLDRAMLDFADALLNCSPKKDDSFLILFINELEEESTLNGRYKEFLQFIPGFIDKYKGYQINHEALDDVFKNQSWMSISDYNSIRLGKILGPLTELPMKAKLMKNIKMYPKDFTIALRSIAAFDDKTLDDAIKFLLYHGDINDLYNDALRTHRIDLAEFVARKSSKDPKEYMPLFDRLNSIESVWLRNFEIDQYVGDYENALKVLIEYHFEVDKLREHEKVILKIVHFIDSKRSYKKALEIFGEAITSGGKKEYREFIPFVDQIVEMVVAKYAKYLLEKRYYIKAGLLYSSALGKNPSMLDYFHGGIKCFELADRWDLSIPLYAKVRMQDDEKYIQALKNLKQSLVNKGEPFVTYIISKMIASSNTDISSDEKQSIDDFIASGRIGCYYADLLGRADVEKRVEIQKFYSKQITSLKEEFKVIYKSAKLISSRLKELLTEYKQKKADSTHLGGKTFAYADDTLSTTDGSEMSSNLSQGSSNSKPLNKSTASIKTRDTSKTTKSQVARRKRMNFKRGSRYEDIALVMKLRESLVKMEKIQVDSFNYLVFIYEFGDIYQEYSEFGFSTSLREIMKRTYDLSLEIIQTFWPSNAGDSSEFSLFERFRDVLSGTAEEIETVDIEILVRPSKPNEPDYLD